MPPARARPLVAAGPINPHAAYCLHTHRITAAGTSPWPRRASCCRRRGAPARPGCSGWAARRAPCAMAIASFYWLTFAAFAAPAAYLEFDHGSGLFGSGKGASVRADRAGQDYVRFRNNYLIVFALMMGGLPPCGGMGTAGSMQWAAWSPCRRPCGPMREAPYGPTAAGVVRRCCKRH
jgi:hypothetical protein